ncbi:polyadenylate-binding protein-interacting protein 1 isoform X2 [Narcine bancroftii]|uniref:polyadenylate-binding protein-interacting protein 1 isoform X2 n=1 Tax=Narcine bancroftii TaxID=1343680 RepID=UPI003832010E
MDSGKHPAFDRAPGAGRSRGRGSGGPQVPVPGGRAQGHGDGAQENGLFAGPGQRAAAVLGLGPGSNAPAAVPPGPAAPNGAPGLQGNGVHVKGGAQHQEPLRQPRSSPPAADYPDSTIHGQMALGINDQFLRQNTKAMMIKSEKMDAFTIQSKLSASAPEFYPPGFMAVSSHLEIDNVSADVKQPSQFEEATTVPNFTYTGARLCNYLSQNLTINSGNSNFRQLLLQRCQTEFLKRGEAVEGDEKTRKKFHSFVLFLGELYINLEIKGVNGLMTRATILRDGLQELLNVLLSKPLDDNLTCAVKLLKLTGSILEDDWKVEGKSNMADIIHRVKNVVLDCNCSRDVKQMLLKLLELRSSNWGRVQTAATYNEATPENDPNYYMNEPVFYSAEGIPLTPADPDYLEKYQEMIDREELLQGYSDEDEDVYVDVSDNEMDPEMEEAYEKFCAETEGKMK